MQLLKYLILASNLVVLEHSVFALPFALSSYVIATRKGTIEGTIIGNYAIVFVILCVITARTAAMGFNRIVDLDFDRENIRTKARELPSGKLSSHFAWWLVLISSFLFLLSSYAIGFHCLILAPFVLGLLFFYSYSKRFTSYSHLILGLSLGLAPLGAWWALRPQIEIEPILLALGVILWVGGFDILYSAQDVEFDRKAGLFSIPAIFGIEKGFYFSRSSHFISAILFGLFAYFANLGFVFYLFYGVVVFSLIYQHLIISPYDLSKINRAFFTTNGFISVLFLIGVLLS